MYSADIVECYQGNLGFAHTVARKCYGRLLEIGASVEYDDVFADVREAFLDAHRSFDPSRGFAFNTYFGRCAYNRINKSAKALEEERITNGVRSFEEMSGEDFDVSERIASEAMTPEEVLERRQQAEQVQTVVAGLSPIAALIVQWLVSPPEALMKEAAAQQAHCDYSRSIGIHTRCMAGVNIGFICKFIRLVMADVSHSEIARAAREVRRVIDTL
ncbi:sigma factor [Paraburkholderia sp.]|uniref:sigma factor n=1 Tax=Paraburkholderia sp. TaxID=1926495 RepID=UPI0039E3636C